MQFAKRRVLEWSLNGRCFAFGRVLDWEFSSRRVRMYIHWNAPLVAPVQMPSKQQTHAVS